MADARTRKKLASKAALARADSMSSRERKRSASEAAQARWRAYYESIIKEAGRAAERASNAERALSRLGAA